MNNLKNQQQKSNRNSNGSGSGDYYESYSANDGVASNIINKHEWSFLTSIDPSRVINNDDIKTLQKVIEILGFSHIDSYALDGRFKNLDHDIIKVMNLSQLSIEYLLSVNHDYELEQKKYQQRIQSLELQLQNLQDKHLKQSEELIQANKDRIADLSKSAANQQYHNPTHYYQQFPPPPYLGYPHMMPPTQPNIPYQYPYYYQQPPQQYQQQQQPQQPPQPQPQPQPQENKSIDEQFHTGRLNRQGSNSSIRRVNESGSKASNDNIKDIVKNEIDGHLNDALSFQFNSFKQEILRMDEQKSKILEKDKKKLVIFNKRMESLFNRIEKIEDVLIKYAEAQQEMQEGEYEQHENQEYQEYQEQTEENNDQYRNILNGHRGEVLIPPPLQIDEVYQPREPIMLPIVNRPYKLPCFIKHSDGDIEMERERILQMLEKTINQKGIVEEEGLEKDDLDHYLTQLDMQRKIDANYNDQLEMRHQLESYLDAIIVQQLYNVFFDPNVPTNVNSTNTNPVKTPNLEHIYQSREILQQQQSPTTTPSENSTSSFSEENENTDAKQKSSPTNPSNFASFEVSSEEEGFK